MYQSSLFLGKGELSLDFYFFILNSKDQCVLGVLLIFMDVNCDNLSEGQKVKETTDYAQSALQC